MTTSTTTDFVVLTADEYEYLRHSLVDTVAALVGVEMAIRVGRVDELSEDGARQAHQRVSKLLLLLATAHERAVVAPIEINYAGETTDTEPLAEADPVSTRRMDEDGDVHEMAELATGSMCGVKLTEAWRPTDLPVTCGGCLAALIEEVRAPLLEVLDADGAGRWLVAPNAMLGGASAVEALRFGRLADVLVEADRLTSGAYT